MSFDPVRSLRDTGAVVPPVRYGHRSFDRQWIIPDGRLINQPNPTLWETHSSRQVYMTALHRTAPSAGPAVTFSAAIPDLDHYNGRGGRVFPSGLTANNGRRISRRACSERWPESWGSPSALPTSWPASRRSRRIPRTRRVFRSDLVQPGLRLPVTADASLFAETVEIGREIIWLHCFGERFADPSAGRPGGPPRMAEGERPAIPKDGAIPTRPDRFPDRIEYDAAARRLKVGDGFIDNVPPAVWEYEISGKQVLVQWFSYRRRDRSRPIIGDRRPPSALERIQPGGWLAEYTTELMNVLHVLGRLVALERRQADLLSRICDGPLISADDLRAQPGLCRGPQGLASGRALDRGGGGTGCSRLVGSHGPRSIRRRGKCGIPN